jgi:hypothetical protein
VSLLSPSSFLFTRSKHLLDLPPYCPFHPNFTSLRHSQTLTINMATGYYQYQPTTTLPVPVPGKQPQQQQQFIPRHTRNPSAYSQYSASPPERAESVTTGGGLYSSASSNYAGSDYDSSTAGATSVDLLDYMNDRLSQTYNPIPLDQNVARQAQM